MDDSLVRNQFVALIKTNFFPLLLVVGGVAFLGYGLVASSVHKPEKENIVFEAAQDKSTESKARITPKQETIAVDIEGAVLKPGIYKLPAESRLHDALIIAGGLAKNADRGNIAKGLNLAAKLTDGGKLYIPFQGEEFTATGGQSVLGSQTSGSASININLANEKELDSLPGVGAVTAQKIIAGRPYKSIDELTQKKIVGQKVFENLKEKITVN